MHAVWFILVYAVLPLWVLCGFLDYLCHRASHMTAVTGVRESRLHWLMLAEVATPMALAVFFEVNALVLALLLLFLAAHEVTGYLDLRLATATRRVSVFEHQLHSLLEVLPLTALLLLMILHWPQAQALFGFGDEAPAFLLRLKPLPPWGEIGPPFLVFLVLSLLPYGEEFCRGLRRRR